MKTFCVRLASLVIALSCATLSRAEPSFGSNCASCHTVGVTGRLQLSGQTTTSDIGLRLDGTAPGPLKTYVANPGDTVRITETVLNGSGHFAVSIRNFDQGGMLGSLNNHLTFTTPNLVANGWTLGSTGGTYYYTGITINNTTPTYNFDITVGATTPKDFYDLAVTFAGRDPVTFSMFSQQEHVYLDVVPEPQTWGVVAGASLIGFGVTRRWWRRKSHHDKELAG